MGVISPVAGWYGLPVPSASMSSLSVPTSMTGTVGNTIGELDFTFMVHRGVYSHGRD